MAPAQQVEIAHKTISIITILIPMSYRIYLWKKVFNVLKVVFVANAPENLSSRRYLLCMNSLSRRHSASWWNSNNLLTVIRVRTCWKVIMRKNCDNGGHHALIHQDILHSYSNLVLLTSLLIFIPVPINLSHYVITFFSQRLQLKIMILFKQIFSFILQLKLPHFHCFLCLIIAGFTKFTFFTGRPVNVNYVTRRPCNLIFLPSVPVRLH